MSNTETSLPFVPTVTVVEVTPEVARRWLEALVASPIAWTVTSARTVDIDTARGPLTVTRGALLIAQQDIELGASDFARVRGRYPSGASGFVLLDESQVLTLSAALLAAP